MAAGLPKPRIWWTLPIFAFADVNKGDMGASSRQRRSH